MGVAKEVLDKLRAEKRTKEADEFQAKIDQAVARDCVAIVTWTGEGEIDAFVEEPTRNGLLAAQPANDRGRHHVGRCHPSDRARRFRRP